MRYGSDSRFTAIIAVGLLIAFFAPGLVFGQQLQHPSPITLRQAVDIALEKNPQRKMALAETRAASAGVKPRGAVLPIASSKP